MKRKYILLSLISILFLLALTAVSATDNSTEMQSVDDSSLNIEINDKLESGGGFSSSDSCDSSSSSESSSSSSSSNSEISYDLTDDYYDDYDDYYDGDYDNDNVDETPEYDGEFEVENINMKYDCWGKEITVWLKDNEGNPLILGDDMVTLHWSDGTKIKLYDNDMVNLESIAEDLYYGYVNEDVYYDWLYDDSYDWEGYSIYTYKPVGTYTVTAVCNDDYYNIKPATFTVKITKGTVKVTPKVYHIAKGGYATLKCKVMDSYGQEVDEGTVTFKINGHSYTVKVRDGWATKKVKLNKAKTYKYTATFTGKNYYSKSASSKVYVYKTSKKARTFKLGKYKIVVPLAKYKKLINAKNTNKLISYSFYTGKKITQKVKMGSKWKTKKKVKVYINIGYGGKTGGQCGVPNKYSMFTFTYYQTPGYDGCKPWLTAHKSRALISNL